MDPQPPPRVVTLVLVTPAGEVVGALPPFMVEVPWWPSVAPVVASARELYGVDVTILRLLDNERPIPVGGAVTYLAELSDRRTARDLPRALRPWDGSLGEHPLRMPWARLGGPARLLEWAHDSLAGRGLALRHAEQIRTWNLSTLWRLEAADHPGAGPVGADANEFWLKAVPPFMAHEGAILEALQTEPVPTLVARADARILIAGIRGEDLYGAPLDRLHRMVAQLVPLQRRWAGREEELLRLGLPDWRAPAITAAIADVVERVAPTLETEDRRTLDRFVAELPDRFRAIASAGLPDTLVHGDFHPGNHRGSDAAITLLDWGDSGVGHPLLDEAAFLDRMDPAFVAPVRSAWHALWREAIPGSDPERAAQLLAPVAAARQALIYVTFLDNIEPSEHPYHAADPPEWLRRTAALARARATSR